MAWGLAGWREAVRKIEKTPEIAGSNAAGQVRDILSASQAKAFRGQFSPGGKRNVPQIVDKMNRKNLINFTTRGMGQTTILAPSPYDEVQERAKQTQQLLGPTLDGGSRMPMPAGGLRQYWNMR